MVRDYTAQGQAPVALFCGTGLNSEPREHTAPLNAGPWSDNYLIARPCNSEIGAAKKGGALMKCSDERVTLSPSRHAIRNVVSDLEGWITLGSQRLHT